MVTEKEMADLIVELRVIEETMNIKLVHRSIGWWVKQLSEENFKRICAAWRARGEPLNRKQKRILRTWLKGGEPICLK